MALPPPGKYKPGEISVGLKPWEVPTRRVNCRVKALGKYIPGELSVGLSLGKYQQRELSLGLSLWKYLPEELSVGSSLGKYPTRRVKCRVKLEVPCITRCRHLPQISFNNRLIVQGAKPNSQCLPTQNPKAHSYGLQCVCPNTLGNS